ncbi:MAG TPA: hypothetical protein VKE41_03065 [Roseiflexaceae bacterium]|nr:hypothetical protein [Roseiflexaceae bacterium]
MTGTRNNPLSATDPRAQWQSRANRRIEFMPGNPGDRACVLKRNENVTAAYAEMYLRNPGVYKWAGMAALTSAAVGRGMYMIHYLKQSRLGLMVGLFGSEVANVTAMLGAGNLAVFEDIYWQHLAYERAGIAELEQIYQAGGLDRRVMRSWRQIDAGRRTNDQELIWEGNRGLLHYEQKQVLQPAVYDGKRELWKALSGWIMSPIPGHAETIEAFAPGANIGVFDDRWAWIEQRMLPRWKELADHQPSRVERRLQVRMLGGPPFLMPEMLTGKLGQSISLAIGLGSRSGGWVPALARSS